MPKPITLEMLHEMTPDQRNTLHRNASGLDTLAARDVLELLSQDNLMEKKAPAKKAAVKKTGTTKPRAPKAAVSKPIKAVYGRQG